MAGWDICVGLVGFVIMYFVLVKIAKYLIERNVLDKDDAEEQVEGITTMLAFIMCFLGVLWMAGMLVHTKAKDEL